MSSTKLEVLFSKRPAPGPFTKNVIALWPSKDEWNDFGRRLRFHAVFHMDDSRKYSTDLQLAFLGENRSSAAVLEETFGDRTGFLPENSLPAFYTLLLSLQDYRSFVEHFGDEARRLLRAVNDLVAVGRGRKPNWYKNVRSEENFTHGLIRSNEAFFAFQNAGDILEGVQREGRSGFSEHLLVNCKLPNFSSAHTIEFRFDDNSVAPKRIGVVIGENGVGKTQLLAHIAKSLLRGDTSVTDPDSLEGRAQISRLIVLEAPRVESSVFPRRAKRRSPIAYIRLSLYRRAGNTTRLGDALVRLARSRETIARQRRISLFLSLVSPIGDPKDIVIKSLKDSDSYSLHDLASTPYTESSALTMYALIDPNSDLWWRALSGREVPLSSGQAALVKLAAEFCLHVERGTLILIDEPETHLHPAFIRHFIDMLDELLVSTGSAAIIATHSAYVVREVSREQVVIMRRLSDGEPEIDQPRLRTLGADIGAISYFVFGDEVNGVVIDKIEKRLSQATGQRNRELASITDELSPEARAQLRRE